MDELGRGERTRVERAGLAAGPALELAVLEVVDVDIAWRDRRFRRQRESVPAAVKAQVADATFRQPHGGELEFRLGIEHRESAAAVVIDDVGHVASVAADVEVFHVPAGCGRDAAALVRDRILEFELYELPVLVGEHVHAAAVGSELRHADADLAGALIQRRE